MSEILLRVRNLTKHFPVYAGIFRKEIDKVYALNGIDFDIRKKEVVGMVGESGCGKTTAGRTLLRLIEPSFGEVFFEGVNFTTLSQRAIKPLRKEMQIVFQDPYSSLNPRKTIGMSIGEGLLYHRLVKTKKELADSIVQNLERVGLGADAIDRYPHQFSGGQQQRICIGRAIALRPKLLVCDEAVSALDVSVQAQILCLLNDLKEELGLSILFISHDLSVVNYICDRIVVMYQGYIVESASAKELYSNPKHPYTEVLLSAIPKEHPDEKKDRTVMRGKIEALADRQQGCPFVGRCPHAKEECAIRKPPKKVFQDSEGNDHEYYCILD
ncbi:ABC transporter ATP-binding protein [Simkania negevensis]|uniref:ABC transporter ATP-binding protein n=1 Tax=Simkania negevensis TaxID=83561 RepID=A0ABS3ASS0_9BACT|nr:ABC transporter ATP-binding protein [Simkania negevensis]